MITKSKLIGTKVVVNGDTESSVMVKNLAVLNGFKVANWSHEGFGRGCYAVLIGNEGIIIGVNKADYYAADDEETNPEFIGLSLLTLADFKKTKVEYVKVDKNADNGAYWECARDYAEGNCQFFTDGDSALPVDCNNTLLSNYISAMLYRRVETEVTWLDELADKYPVHIQGDIIELTVTEFHKDTFAEMCSFVHNANK